MSIKKTTILSTSLIVGSIATLAPTTIVSCSNFNIKDGDLGRYDQITLLSSAEAKQAILDTWLTDTFTTLYAQNILQESSSSVIKDLKDYLTNLEWNKETKLTSDQQQDFADRLYDAYKFYITFKSTIKSSGGENSSDPSTYFLYKAIEWKEAELTPINSSDPDIAIGNFNPGINYLPPSSDSDSNAQKFKKEFEILMKVRGTAVYSEVLKLLISEMYFVHAQEQQILIGTNYNKLIKKPSSVDYINAKAFDVKDRFYFLLKYLVSKNPQFNWSYTNSDYTVETEFEAISTYEQFNNINTNIVQNIYENISPLSPDTLVDKSLNLSKIHAYSGIKTASSQEGNSEGDLSNDIEDIKIFGNYKVGLLNTDQNQLMSFSDLQAINKLKELKGNGSNVGVPAIYITKGSQNKISPQLEIKDFEMKFDNQIGSYDATQNIYSLALNDNHKQKWELKRISFPPVSSEKFVIYVDVNYSFSDNNVDYSLHYQFKIENWNNGIDQSINPFKSQYLFLDDNSDAAKIFTSKISILKDGKPSGVDYILRVLPFFDKQGSININGSWYMTGKFSLDNTIWASTKIIKNGKTFTNDKPAITLARFFVMSDSELFKQIQDYYLFNNFVIESNNSETQTLIKELGLSKKTKKDRENAGLPA